jgi:hypothetical protein
MSIGERIGPREAGRAEVTNLAARHIHTLRHRLTDTSAIVTADHAYRIAPGLGLAMTVAPSTSVAVVRD